jgi:hypothetical protein
MIVDDVMKRTTGTTFATNCTITTMKNYQQQRHFVVVVAVVFSLGYLRRIVFERWPRAASCFLQFQHDFRLLIATKAFKQRQLIVLLLSHLQVLNGAFRRNDRSAEMRRKFKRIVWKFRLLNNNFQLKNTRFADESYTTPKSNRKCTHLILAKLDSEVLFLDVFRKEFDDDMRCRLIPIVPNVSFDVTNNEQPRSAAVASLPDTRRFLCNRRCRRARRCCRRSVGVVRTRICRFVRSRNRKMRNRTQFKILTLSRTTAEQSKSTCFRRSMIDCRVCRRSCCICRRRCARRRRRRERDLALSNPARELTSVRQRGALLQYLFRFGKLAQLYQRHAFAQVRHFALWIERQRFFRVGQRIVDFLQLQIAVRSFHERIDTHLIEYQCL